MHYSLVRVGKVGNSTMGTREFQKTARRRAILDAARALILDDKGRDFSMPALAAKAGVSLVTPYNLFGSKSGILVEIVREDIFEQVAGIAALPHDSLAAWAAALSRSLAAIYYRGRHYYRRMIVTLAAQESGESQRATLDLGYRLFDSPLRILQQKGALSAIVPADLLARHCAHGVFGALQHRLMERGSEDLLRHDIEMALLLTLSGLAADGERPAIGDRLRRLAEMADGAVAIDT
jgi:AcrR family transcriptional regulator